MSQWFFFDLQLYAEYNVVFFNIIKKVIKSNENEGL